MKKNLILYSSLTVLLGACSKDHDDSNNSNTWTLGGTTYKASNVAFFPGVTPDLIAISGEPANTVDWIDFLFMNSTTTDGQVLITDTHDLNTVQIKVSKLVANVETHYSNGETNVNANVTVKNGKVSVNFPGKIWLHNESNSSDSAQLSIGTITEQ